MKLITIVADSAAQAIAEVHRQLGPQAIVVNVRKTSAPGLSRVWKKPQIEVQATLPAPPAPAQQPRNESVVELNKKISQLKQQLASSAVPRPKPAEPRQQRPSPIERKPREPIAPAAPAQNEPLDLTRMLESLGILPLHAQWLVDQVRGLQAGRPEFSLKEEFIAVQEFLIQYWNRLASGHRNSAADVRILVGAPGVGKTTCLCKWLTQEVLVGNQSARVWRLDGSTANTAEFLSIHGEILGVPVERVWTAESAEEGSHTPVQYVDLPGVSATDSEAIAALAEQIKVFDSPQILLVLNAAYDLNHLLTHARAFSVLPLAGLILTHVDEENRWSKFWNLLMGAKLPVVYLSGGQNIPGDFGPASPRSLFDVSLE